MHPTTECWFATNETNFLSQLDVDIAARNFIVVLRLTELILGKKD